jgi:hypothetical protein
MFKEWKQGFPALMVKQKTSDTINPGQLTHTQKKEAVDAKESVNGSTPCQFADCNLTYGKLTEDLG